MDACIDFGGSAVKLGVSREGVLHSHAEFANGADAADLARAAGRLQALAAGANIDRIAIAVPGIVDADGRRLREAHGKYAWLLDLDLAQWAHDTFDAPALIENDARAALVGETASGVAAGDTDAVVLVLGTGIGTAAMIDGALVRGLGGTAGVLGGHVTIDRAGPGCNCGNIGCAEVFGSSWALPARIEAWQASGLASTRDFTGGFAAVAAGVRDGDSLARAVWDEAVQAWAMCAVSLCHAYAPRTVIIAGGVARSADLVTGPLATFLNQHLWGAVERPRVVASASPEISVVRGLAALAMEMEI